MKYVGEILKNERLKQGLTTLQIASSIKTKDKFILAIEENNFSVFPGEVFALSFVRDYAELLGLNPDEVSPYFRRTIELERQKNPDKVNVLTNQEKSVFSQGMEHAGKNISKTILSVGTILIIVAFVSFLIFEYQRNILHPQLEVTAPIEDTKTNSENYKITGKTEVENKIFVNGEEVEIDGKGNFKVTLPLKMGINKVSIKSINSYQKVTEEIRYILREK